MYYLQSRYYDPEVGRFLNADAFPSTGQGVLGNNMFAYCGNNPISRTDTGGTFWNIVAGAVIGGISSFIGSIVTNLANDVKEGASVGITMDELCDAAISGCFGAMSGAAVAMCPALGSFVNSTFAFCETLVNGYREYKRGETDMGTVLYNAAISATLGAITGSGGSDWANISLLDDAASAFARTAAGNHPAVKDAAKRLIKQAGKLFVKSLSSSLCEDMPWAFLEWGIQETAEAMMQ